MCRQSKSQPNEELFTPEALRKEYFKDASSRQYDFKTFYIRACEELTLQQEKRDRTISIYVAVIAFLVPFLFKRDTGDFQLGPVFIGWVLVIAGFIGVFFSQSVIRYRVYKEVYWITCRVISQLQSICPEHIKKDVIQQLYIHGLNKKWSKFITNDDSNKKRRIRYGSFLWEQLNSAEYYMFATIALVSSLLLGFGFSFLIQACVWWFCALGVLVFVWLSFNYFRSIISVFRYLADHSKKSFNKSFGKAWFLHIYTDDLVSSEEGLPMES
jgi:hypothetical protein